MEGLKKIIHELDKEAEEIQTQSRALTRDEMDRIKAINQAMALLSQALPILSPKSSSTIITYKIISDMDGKLKGAARVACNFWNRYIVPDSSIVIRLGVFTADSNTIARAYEPYQKDGVVYGVVEFNTKYLSTFSRNEISGTIIHEIGHTLGFGWDKWMGLFDNSTGVFTENATKKLSDLRDMRVETDYGPGTQYSHWDEELHDKELMTGFKDKGEHVLPVTVNIMSLLGHRVVEKLTKKTDLATLLDGLAQIKFSREEEAKTINRDHFEPTPIRENIPHNEPL